MDGKGVVSADVLGPGAEDDGDVGSVGGEGNAHLVVVGLLGVAGIGLGHPVARADKGALAEDGVSALLLAVGVGADLKVVGAGDAVGLVARAGGAGNGGVGVGGEDGVDLGGGEVGELDGEPSLQVSLGGDGVGNEEGALVGDVL